MSRVTAATSGHARSIARSTCPLASPGTNLLGAAWAEEDEAGLLRRGAVSAEGASGAGGCSPQLGTVTQTAAVAEFPWESVPFVMTRYPPGFEYVCPAFCVVDAEDPSPKFQEKE